MDIHYNAFISYRHHPADIKVAEQIHRGLEHYRIPKALKQKNTGKLRLFRDKEELPITSNLTDDITRALNNSDFLIVICSTHTKDSIWVQREIDAFLQTHDRNRILTVIVDGEPYEVIPESLCTEEQQDPVTGQLVQLPIEPLSCDWRTSKRKAHHEELPRLAAALLGCGYDELRQRERQYQMRRMATIFSAAMAAALAFSAYVIRNNLKIQEANAQLTDANIAISNNLAQAQINQSQFLASASQQQFEAGDRMQAMALALKALPGEENNRPYVARAEKALADAVGAYLSTEETAAVGVINCDAFIRLFAATDQRDWMFVTDQRNMLSVWDLKTFQQAVAINTASSVSRLLVTPADTVIVHTDNTITCYDTKLQSLWRAEDVSQVHLSEARTEVIVKSTDDALTVLDAATGESLGFSAQINLAEDDWDFRSASFHQEFYDWQKPLILDYYFFGNEHTIVSADLINGTVHQISTIPKEFLIRGTTYTQDGNILILTVSADNKNGFWDTMSTNSKVDVQIICMAPDGTRLWTTDLTSYSYSETWTLYPIPDTNQVFCQVDNILAVLDVSTGEIQSCCQISSIPLWVKTDEEAATIILQDGAIGSYYYDENEFNSFHYFKDNLNSGFAGKGVFVKQRNSTEILIYTTIMDKNWQTFTGDYDTYVDEFAVGDNLLAVQDLHSIYVLDAKTQNLLWDIAETGDDRFTLLGFTEQGTYLWISCNGKEIIRFHTATGQEERFPLPTTTDQGETLYQSEFHQVQMDESHIYILSKELMTDIACLVTMEIATGQTSVIRLDDVGLSFDHKDCDLLTAKNGITCLWFSGNNTLYQIHADTREVRVFTDGLRVAPVIQHLNDGSTYMLTTDETVSFYTLDGTLLFSLNLENQRGISAYRTTEDELLLLTDAGNLYRYSPTGTRLSEITVHLYNTFSSYVSSTFSQSNIQWTETGDGDLFLNIFKSGNLIDMACWESRAWVPQCIAYLPDLDQFVTIGRDPNAKLDRFGAFPRYTTEDIRQMALDALNGYSLTSEKQEYYGIS